MPYYWLGKRRSTHMFFCREGGCHYAHEHTHDSKNAVCDGYIPSCEEGLTQNAYIRNSSYCITPGLPPASP